jgi:hypothetical protein
MTHDHTPKNHLGHQLNKEARSNTESDDPAEMNSGTRNNTDDDTELMQSELMREAMPDVTNNTQSTQTNPVTFADEDTSDTNRSSGESSSGTDDSSSDSSH